MKSLVKNSKGITLISLVITVAIISILTNVVIYNAVGNLKSTKLGNMQNDIENLRDKVSNYYSQYGKIPANTEIEYTNIGNLESTGIISDTLDTGKFYVIDLAAMENVTLNYGRDYEKITNTSTQEEINGLTDLYIINEFSHNIFYVEGIELDGEMFYTDYTSDDVDKVAADLRYYDGVEIPDGFYYVGGTKDTGIVISDVQGDDLDNSKQGNQFVWVPVENEEDYVRNTSYSLTEISTTAYTDTGYLPDEIQPHTDEAAYNEEAEKQAVMNAKGFFVSRFEAGNENGNLVSKKGATVWNEISQEDCKIESKNFINSDSVRSALCSSIQWDMIMNFVDGKLDGTDETYSVKQYDSRRHTSLTTSGQNEADKVCNIYDLEGNYFEYVPEMNTYYTNDPFVVRGGYYNTSFPASDRHSANGGEGTNSSFRFILYVIPRDNWSPSYDETATYTDANGDTATIPQDFFVSRKPNEKTINDGLVVKDESGNEFVWIPVEDINTMAQCSTAGGDCNLQLQGDTLKCTTHNSEEIVGKLYALEQGGNFGIPNTTYDANSGLREPAIVTGNTSGTGTSYDASSSNLSKIGYSSSTEMLNDLKLQYKEMATSVAKYKGFYVGRYELGLDTNSDNKPTSKIAENGVTTADATNSDTDRWYGLYKKCKEYEGNSVISSMIWGSQYDTMMNWMQDNGEDVNSSDSTKQSNNSYVTGSDSTDIIKNIYDLYACHREWTLEATSSDGRVRRSGDSSSTYSPSYRNYNVPTSFNSNNTTRLTLYIK